MIQKINTANGENWAIVLNRTDIETPEDLNTFIEGITDMIIIATEAQVEAWQEAQNPIRQAMYLLKAIIPSEQQVQSILT